MTETSLKKLEEDALEFPERAKLIIIHNNEMLSKANVFLVSVKELRKEIANTFNPIIEKAHKAHKEAVAQKKRYEEPLIEAEKIIKLQIASYMSEQERIREEALEKARKEEEERQGIQEEKLKKAEEYEKVGLFDEADAIKEEIPLQKTVEAPLVPKLEKVGIRKILKWRVVNKNKVPREYLIVDSARITRIVQSLKLQANLPGIEVYYEDSVTARTGD